jgi:hypothetical protein
VSQNRLRRESKPQMNADTFTLSRMSTGPVKFRSPRIGASRRWIMLLVASILLHFTLLGWISDGNIGSPARRDQAPPMMAAHLLSLQQNQPPAAPISAPPQTKPVAKIKKPTPRVASAAATPAESVPGPNETVTAQRPLSTQSELAQASEAFIAMETGLPATNAVENNIAANTPESAAVEKAEVKADMPPYKISIPPSAELKYTVQALREGQMVYGSGKISWNSNGDNYTVNGEAGILFFTLLNFTSAGVIDSFGVAPVIYSEKRFRRPETNTHFHRERNTISFSASTATYPRKGGEQDRASIVWQLTGIGRGESDRFRPGTEIDFFVAGVRDAAHWRVRVIGEEEIEIGSGKVNAWHVVRIPKQGSYDQKLDIWLAPQHEWYPVKIRFTESNGEYLDMLLSNIAIAATD